MFYIIKTITLFLFFIIFSLEASICFEGVDCTNYSVNNKLKNLLLQKSTKTINKDINVASIKKQTTNNQAKKTIITDKAYLLTDIITINYYNKPLKEVLAKILPKWNINIDNNLLNIKLDVIMQTTRKQAVTDLANSLSAKVLFYHNTKPLPTVSIIKI